MVPVSDCYWLSRVLLVGMYTVILLPPLSLSAKVTVSLWARPVPPVRGHRRRHTEGRVEAADHVPRAAPLGGLRARRDRPSEKEISQILPFPNFQISNFQIGPEVGPTAAFYSMLYFHRSAWANLHISGKPNTFLAASTRPAAPTRTGRVSSPLLAIPTPRNCCWGPRNIHYEDSRSKIFPSWAHVRKIPGGRNRARRSSRRRRTTRCRRCTASTRRSASSCST